MEGGWPAVGGFLLCLTVNFLLQGRGNIFIISCSGFDQHRVDSAAFQALFDLKVCPATKVSTSTQVNISFICLPSWKEGLEWLHHHSPLLLLTWLWMWDKPLITECISNNRLTVSAENLWLPDISIVEYSMDVDQVPPGLTTYLSSQGRIIAPQTLHAHFHNPGLLAVDSMLLEKELWTQGEWELLNTSKATPKMLMDSNLYDQIISYMANRCRPSLFISNLLVPSSFPVTIDTLSFFFLTNLASLKITLLLGYNVFLLMMNDLLPASGTPLISVDFALCLSLMVLSLLETIFISYLLHLATTQPPPMPRWLHFLLLHCTSPRTCCPAVPQKENMGLAHLPGEGSHLWGMCQVPEKELNGFPRSTQKQHLDSLWVQLSHMMDTLLFCLYLLFMATSITMVIVL
uniref:5-hydroxytryptamine receptor 3C n=1 Tax=Capra hircus TaxID=9925 RepID=A0A452FBM5_CAPHI